MCLLGGFCFLEINCSSLGKLEKRYSFNKPSINTTEKIRPGKCRGSWWDYGDTYHPAVTHLSQVTPLHCLLYQPHPRNLLQTPGTLQRFFISSTHGKVSPCRPPHPELQEQEDAWRSRERTGWGGSYGKQGYREAGTTHREVGVREPGRHARAAAAGALAEPARTQEQRREAHHAGN